MIDLATLWALLALVDGVLAVVVGFGLHARPQEGAAQWTGSLAVRALSFVLFASAMEPRAGTVAVAAGLLALSMTLQAGALLAFDRRALPAWVHYPARRTTHRQYSCWRGPRPRRGLEDLSLTAQPR